LRDLDALYQEIILDHNRRPRNYGELAGADKTVAGRNPLCGDEMTLWVKVEDDRIADARFVAQGCAVSKASASLMTTVVKGKTLDEADALFDRVHKLVTGKLSEDERTGMGALAALGGVARFPIRVKCASLPWHALRRALADGESKAAVTTE
jgi:nitrogen fixation NifU-like protein